MGKILCEEGGGEMEETDWDWERLAAPEICCSCLLLGVEGIGLLLLEGKFSYYNSSLMLNG